MLLRAPCVQNVSKNQTNAMYLNYAVGFGCRGRCLRGKEN